MWLTDDQIRAFAAGVQTVERLPDAWRFQRLPPAMDALYGRSDGLRSRARCTSGVRIRFTSDTRWIRIRLRYGEQARWYFNGAVVVDGARMDAFGPLSRQEEWDGLAFSQLTRAAHAFDLWFPHLSEAMLLGIEVEDGCYLRAVPAMAFRWLALGDSIAQGMNASQPVYAWLARLALRLSADVCNAGVGGATLQAELAGAVQGVAADVVTVGYGANDWNIGVPVAEYRKNAETLVGALRSALPEAAIVLMTPVPFFRATKPNTRGETLDAFREALSEVGARADGVRVLHGPELMPADHAYFNDWSHPNDAGMDMIAGNVRSRLEEWGLIGGPKCA